MKTEEFIKRAIEIHGGRYDYSKVVYKERDTKVCIICPEHGEFWQTPHNHLKGSKCPKCSGTYKPTTEEWIQKAREIHGDKYDYSKVEYKTGKDKVCIICPEHGEFWQIANNHLKGEGCIKCRNEKLANERKMTKDEFIERSKKIHGEKYNYENVVYKNFTTKVCIICPKHGEFYQTPVSHLNGYGCPECRKKIKEVVEKVNKKELLKEKYLSRFKELYNGKYIYEDFNYESSGTKIAITCPEHGIFYKTIAKHLKQGCPQCKKDEKKKEIENKTDLYITKAKSIHGEKYDYSEVLYKGQQSKIKIICHSKDKDGNEHGVFLQNPNSHINGCGCPKCAQENRTLKQTKTTEEFISQAKEKYPEFDYSEVNYINNTTPIKIICHKKFKNGKEHGEFYVSPNKFLGRGTTCPHCSSYTSKPEIEIIEFIKNLIGEDKVKTHDRKTLGNGLELDIFIPQYNIAFEFNGLYWHSDCINHITKNSHIEKTNICEEKGIQLVQIFSDEYFEHKEIVLAKIKHMLKISEGLSKIMARKCDIKEITCSDAKIFLEKNHIQGFAPSTVYLGAFYNDILVAVMTFVKDNGENNFCLNRFATDINYISSGLGGKLFNYFIKKYNPSVVKSFADRRWSNRNKNLYLTIGFKEDKIIPPDYRYISVKKPSLGRFHKFNFRKKTLNKKFGLPLTMTETEMTKTLGYSKIYDCGLIKYIWKKTN